MSTSRRLQLVLIVGATWLASAGVAECSYRLLGVHVAATMGGFYQSFGQGNYRHRPLANTFMNWYSGSFSVHTDSLGFRVGTDAEVPAHPPNPDVLVIGDSQAFGQGVEFEDSVFGGFAREAQTLGITVANAAVGGHFLRDQIELVRSLATERGLHPQLLIVCVTPRSLANFAAGSHVFVRDDGALFDQPPGLLQLGRKWLSTHSSAYVVLRNAIRGRDSGDSAAELLGLYQGARSQERINGLSNNLADLKRVTESFGARLVLVYLPLAADFRVDDLARRLARPADQVSAREPYLVADAVARAQGIPLLDLTPPLRAALERGESLSLRGDPHYNQAVSRSCARYLVTALDWRALTNRKLAHEN
jgi:hypothetical protein